VPHKGDEAGAAARDFASAWDRVRGDDTIQFTPWTKPPPKPDEPPEWLKKLLEWLGDILGPVAGNWPIIKWGVLALIATLVLWFLWKTLGPIVQRWLNRTAPDAPEEFVPDSAKARTLLTEAEALAERGAYDEAVHLLLMRSVEDIAIRRPDLLHPSSTTREIGALHDLGERTRACFAAIGERVEASRFAGRPLGPEDWSASRTAYGEFAGLKLS
jgi:hypothetical protein